MPSEKFFPVPAFRNVCGTDLAEVIAEQEQRARIRQLSRRNDDQDHYCARQQTTAELESVKRQLQANLGLVTADFPARVPIRLTCGQLTVNSPIALTAIISADYFHEHGKGAHVGGPAVRGG